MARRPRYQRVGVGLDRPAQLDFAGLRETARTAQTISQQIDRMSQFVYKEQARAAEQRGRQMVADMGAQPALQQLAAQGGPTNIEQRAAYDTANRIAAAEIETAASIEIDKVIADAEINKSNFADVQSNLQDITDGFPAALSDLDPQTAGLLRQRLGQTAAKAEARYGIYYNNLQIKEAQGRALQGIDIRKKNILRSAASDLANRDEVVAAEIESLSQYMRDFRFDEDDISRVVLDIKGNTVTESLLFDFRQLQTLEEKRNFVAKQKEILPGKIGEDKARSAINKLQTDINKVETGLKGQATTIKKTIGEQRKILSKGGLVSEQILDSLDAKIGGLGEFGDEAAAELGKLKRMNLTMQGIRNMNPVELQDTVNEFRGGIGNMGGEGVDTLEEVEIIEAADSFLTNMKTQLAKDPLSWGIKTGLIDYRPLDLTDRDGLEQQAAERIEAAHTVANRYGIEPKFLTDEEANTFTKIMQDDEIGQQMMVLAGLTEVFGEENVGGVFAQIADKDKEIGHVAGLIGLDAHQIAAEALEGRDLLKGGYKPAEFTPTNTMGVFYEVVGNSMVMQPDAMNSGMLVAQSIYAKRANRRALDQFDDTLWRESIQAAFGQQMGMGGIQTVFGDQTLLPKDVSADRVEYAFNNMTPDDLYRASGVKLNDELFKYIFKPSESGYLYGEYDAKFNSDFSLINVGYGEYILVLGDPNTAGAKTVVGDYTDDMGGVEGERQLQINLNKLLRLE